MNWFKQHLNWVFIITTVLAVLLLIIVMLIIERANSETIALFLTPLNICIVLGWFIVGRWVLNRKRKG